MTPVRCSTRNTSTRRAQRSGHTQKAWCKHDACMHGSAANACVPSPAPGQSGLGKAPNSHPPIVCSGHSQRTFTAGMLTCCYVSLLRLRFGRSKAAANLRLSRGTMGLCCPVLTRQAGTRSSPLRMTKQRRCADRGDVMTIPEVTGGGGVRNRQHLEWQNLAQQQCTNYCHGILRSLLYGPLAGQSGATVACLFSLYMVASP